MANELVTATNERRGLSASSLLACLLACSLWLSGALSVQVQNFYISVQAGSCIMNVVG